MTQRTLLLVALGLMAAGLLLGTVTAIAGGGASPLESRQAPGPQEGPNDQEAGPGGGGFRGVRPGGAGTWRPLLPGINPRPNPSPSPTA
mgnify:CR=1 FL=1